MERFKRTESLIGKEKLDLLKNATVFIFGVGGVGGFAAESLARAGIENIGLVDYDKIHISNINRQIHALDETVGESKVSVMKKRMESINPHVKVSIFPIMADESNIREILRTKPDYVIDAIDMVTSKLALIEFCVKNSIPIVSSMGTGNKLHPEMLQIDDIHKTSVCPLAKVIRKELKKREIKRLKVVYSKEAPIKKSDGVIGSISTVPPAAGILLASIAINDIMEEKGLHKKVDIKSECEV